MSDSAVKELKRRDANNRMVCKDVRREWRRTVVGGEQAKGILHFVCRGLMPSILQKLHNKFRGMSSILDKSVAETLAVIEAVHTA